MAAGNDLKLRVLLDAIDRVSGPFKRIAVGSSAVAKALKATQGELKRLEALQRDMTGFRKLESELGGTSSKLAAAQRELRRLSDDVNAAEHVTEEMTAQLRRQAAVVGDLRQQEERQRRAVDASRRALEQAGVSAHRLAVHERELQTRVQRANAELEQQRSRLTRLAAAQRRMNQMHSAGMKLAAHGAGAVAAGTVASRGVAVPVRAYADQEEAKTQLSGAMMGADGKVSQDFAEIDALAQKLGNRLPGTTSDFYEMFTMLRRQGMSSQSILGGLGEATGYLAVQLKLGYSEAAEFSAKLQDATRTNERDMMALGDVIQRTFYLGVDSNNMLEGFSKLSPALKVLRMEGLAGAKALAPLLVMADQAGMQGEAAGNAYRKVLQYSMDADKVGKANALMKGRGVRLDFTDGKGEFGGIDQMFAQLKKLEKLNTQDQLAVMKKLFGDDAETLQVVSLLISKGANGYAEVQAKMAAQADLQQRVNAQLGTLKNLWDAASGTFMNGLAAMGEAVAPELKSLTEWLGNVAERFQTWTKENPRLAGGLLKVAAVLTALLVGAGALAVVAGTVLMPFAGLQMMLTTAMPLFSSVGGLFLRLATGILPMLATGIRLVGAAMIANPIGILLALIAGLIYLVWRRWDVFGPMFAAAWGVIASAASAAWQRLKEIFGGVMSYVAGAWDVIAGIFSGDGGRIRSGLAQMWNAINSVLGGWPAKMLQAGVDMLSGFINGVRSKLGAVKDVIASVGSGAIGGLKSLLGIHSPSRVFATLGDYTMQGFAGGLQRSQRHPLQQVASFGSRLQAAGAGLAIAAGGSAVAVDNRAPVSRAPVAAAAAGPARPIEIHIHGAPMDQAQEVARLVRLELERHEREQAARRRSRLADYD